MIINGYALYGAIILLTTFQAAEGRINKRVSVMPVVSTVVGYYSATDPNHKIFYPGLTLKH